MSAFYVTLLSDSSYSFFPDNTISHFTTKLAKTLNLDRGNWVVGLAEIYIPTALDVEKKKPICPAVTINLEGHAPIEIPHGKYNSIESLIANLPVTREIREKVLAKSKDGVKLMADGITITIPSGGYKSLLDLFQRITAVNELPKDYIKSEILNFFQSEHNLYAPAMRHKRGTYCIKTMIKVPNEGFITIPPLTYSSINEIVEKLDIDAKSKQDLLKETASSITLMLGNESFSIPPANYRSFAEILTTLNLTPFASTLLARERETIVELVKHPPLDVETNLSRIIKRSVKIEQEINNSMIFVYTDIIEPQLVGDVDSKCLRIINAPHLGSHKFQPIYYYPLSRNIIENIEILITDKMGQKLPFSNSFIPTHLTLHFKKI